MSAAASESQCLLRRQRADLHPGRERSPTDRRNKVARPGRHDQLTLATHETALALASRYGFAFYDALIAASALEAGCATLRSEDMQDGQVIEGRLTIRYPFRQV